MRASNLWYLLGERRCGGLLLLQQRLGLVRLLLAWTTEVEKPGENKLSAWHTTKATQSIYLEI